MSVRLACGCATQVAASKATLIIVILIRHMLSGVCRVRQSQARCSRALADNSSPWCKGELGIDAIDPAYYTVADGDGQTKRRAKQASMWVATQDLPRSAAHPFYRD